MDKAEKRKVIIGAILLAVLIALFIVASVYITNSGVAAIQLGGGSAAYLGFLDSLKFVRIDEEPKKWINLCSTLLIYLGLALFIAGIILVFLKRSFRFLDLPITGMCSFEIVAFLLQVQYELQFGSAAATGGDKLPFVIALWICLLVLGLGAFVLSFIFPRRLNRYQEDAMSN